MRRRFPDQRFWDTLQNAELPAKLCDESGKVIGTYLPEWLYRGLLNVAGGNGGDIDKPVDEATRRQALEDYRAGRCKTTEEVLKSLEELRRCLEEE